MKTVNLIFLGAPGAGKGTVAAKLAEQTDLTPISTGDLFRAAVKNETDLGLKVKSIMEAGGLVPDELTIALVKERLASETDGKGVILDGFPRTIAQADALKTFFKIDAVINFIVPDEKIIKRLSGRRLCRQCNAGYHIEYMPPKTENVCDACGGELFTRKDDSPESIQNRLAVYAAQTQPLIDYYKKEGLLIDIDGTPQPDTVCESVRKAIGC